MQQHAEEQRDYHGDGCKCPDQTPRYPVANEGEEGQKQEEGPVYLHVYTCHSSYLESTAHSVWILTARRIIRKIGGVSSSRAHKLRRSCLINKEARNFLWSARLMNSGFSPFKIDSLLVPPTPFLAIHEEL